MRRILPFFVTLILVLSACAKPASSDGSTSFTDGAGADASNMTGAKNAEGKAYISGGDARVGSTVTHAAVQPTTPKLVAATTNPVEQAITGSDDEDAGPTPPDSVTPPPAPVPVLDNSLKGRIREFEISRFDKGSDNARRFGSDTVTLKLFSRNNHTLDFEKMKLQSAGEPHKFSFRGTVGDYTLTGKSLEDIVDKNSTEIYKSIGEFDLVNIKTGEKAKIWYNAYRARLKVREDLENPVKAGSNADITLKRLQDDTFGWVHNWAVDGGVGFFLVDIIRRIHSNQPEQVNSATAALPVFMFKGESVKTDDGPSQATSLTPDTFTNVQTVGNSENEGLRLIAAQVSDPQTKDKTNFMLDVVEDNPEIKAPLDETAANEEAPADDSQAVSPEQQAPRTNSGSGSQPRSTPSAPKAQKTTTAPKVAKITDSYLPINMAFDRAKRLDHDVTASANRSLPGVVGFMSSSDLRNRLSNFFWNAAPFRAFIESVANTLQTSAAFVYPAAVESQYFQGGSKKFKAYNNLQYHWDGGILAVGPFQMHWDTAKDLHITQYGNSRSTSDERLYFAPATCGAALFLNNNMKSFMTSDTTFALLAYNQGAGGARTLARRYGYHYSTLSRASANINEAFRKYGDRQIAMYLMAREMSANGFTPSKYNNSDYSGAHGTVIPPHGIADATCRQLAQQAGLNSI